MVTRLVRRVVPVALLSLLAVSGALARANFEASGGEHGDNGLQAGTRTQLQSAGHNVGKIVLTVSNNGQFGSYGGGGEIDAFTGLAIPPCEYPKRGGSRYLFVGLFWIGAVVGRDTLVSTGADGWTPNMFEFYPDEPGVGEMRKRSSDKNDRYYSGDAVSDQDYIAVYTDTFTTSGGGVALDPDGITKGPHKPLGIEITQNSYSWSYSYAEDFVLFDYRIKNIAQNRLRNVYMGIYVDADVFGQGTDGNGGAQDDACGFRQSLPTPKQFSGSCDFLDTVNIAYIFDVDGDPEGTNLHAAKSVPHVTGTRIVRTPSESLDVSFNWWFPNNGDFGPQTKRKYRPMGPGGGLGTPVGDVNKYHLLRNKEFDYDQILVGKIPTNDSVWFPPLPLVTQAPYLGADTRYLLSFGPFNIDPGQELPLSFAYIAGEDFHVDPKNVTNNFAKGDVDTYYKNLSFADLGLNSTWASWIYDNPGVDTDGDKYFGKRRFCADTTGSGDSMVIRVDTFWYEGDGVPDFTGAKPPESPKIWVTGSTYKRGNVDIGKIDIRFNGAKSEASRDIFSKELDFEGYNVYLSRDNRSSSYSWLESYDKRDYIKRTFVRGRTGQWPVLETPFTLQQLRDLYGPVGDSTWDPLELFNSEAHAYKNNPYNRPGLNDAVFYFEPQGANRTDPSQTRIRKIYSDTVAYPKPPDEYLLAKWDPDSTYFGTLDSITREMYFTDDNYLKYYEYQFTIDNLLPTIPYYVNVTAFDYGSPKTQLGSLETPRDKNPLVTFALPTSEAVNRENLKAYVYPNPYRGDAGYREDGFEGESSRVRVKYQGGVRADKARTIHFANLPGKCTIRVFTLDGDLVKQIDHDPGVDDCKNFPDDCQGSHAVWDMITRNLQLVVSGMYYWTVEDTHGNTQVGKLVIIL